MAEIKFSTGSGNNMNIDGKSTKKWTIIILIVIGAAILIFNCFAIVEEGFIGVKYRFGAVVQDDLVPGLNFKIPFIEEIRHVEMRNQIYTFEGDAYTRDTQRVNNLRIKLTYRYHPDYMTELIQDVGIANVVDRYLVPHVQKISRDTIGRTNAERLVQSRGDIQFEIQETLERELAPFGIVVTAVAIENIAFESEFEDSIQRKVIAEQDALRMENVTVMRREEAEQVVIAAQARADSVLIEAKAEAEAIELIQAQIAQNQAYIEYLKIINWNGILPQVIGDGVNPFVVLGADNNNMARPANQPVEQQQ
ncbi:MAG: prohibitin family protein [Oscillospiraceae bacterium]|jgi:regulator of protease activity HflC (stomatin/prohibitin superfamily)|nr:prohibitin family protein [Oscillospiraceae bacterium]